MTKPRFSSRLFDYDDDYDNVRHYYH